jgi:hypothetical protein
VACRPVLRCPGVVPAVAKTLTLLCVMPAVGVWKMLRRMVEVIGGQRRILGGQPQQQQHSMYGDEMGPLQRQEMGFGDSCIARGSANHRKSTLFRTRLSSTIICIAGDVGGKDDDGGTKEKWLSSLLPFVESSWSPCESH